MSRDLRQLLLRRPRRTLAVAESMTCGRLQCRIGEISGASDFFLGGITAYTLDEKFRHLGVPRAAARRVNCVSRAVAERMAQGACTLFGSDFALAVTGYAEPDRKHRVTVPFAWWALARKHGGKRRIVAGGRIECPGATRVQAQAWVAAAVVAGLEDYLRQEGKSSIREGRKKARTAGNRPSVATKSPKRTMRI